MTNYIDREAMLEQIARRESLMVGDKMISIDALREFIMNRPIADVEEVKHGHWIYYPECGVTKCSVCHRSVNANYVKLLNGVARTVVSSSGTRRLNKDINEYS